MGRGMDKIESWANKIVTHFWFCCEMYHQNVEHLKVNLTFIITHVCFFLQNCMCLHLQIGLLHHISVEHLWETGV